MSDRETEKALFDNLRAELEDPVLQQALEEVRYWDEKLRHSEIYDPTLVKTIESSLAKRWSPWQGQVATVTGYAHRVLDGGEDIRPDPVLVTPDEEVISKGFIVIHTDVDGENIHGNPYGSQYRVVHEMRRKLDNGGYEKLYAFINNHDIQFDSMSVEYAKRWLDHTQVDFLHLYTGSN